MEVTRQNFNDVLENLSQVFKNAQFIAFDTEFTGLKVEGASNLNFFDTLEDLYLRNHLIVETFMVIQFGVVAFFYDEKNKRYTHQGFNFYVYPSSYVDINFTCQNKNIIFLTQHGFDFNKLFKDGIPYLKDADVEKLLEKLEEKFEKTSYDNSRKMEISSAHQSIVDEIINKIKEILTNKSKKSFITERCNSYIRKLLYSSIQNEFGSKVFVETNKNETLTISVGYSAEELKEKRQEKYLKEKKEILNEVGFSKVIKLIIESKKLLIGHNLFLDILFTIHQFLTPLPESYCEFKELVKFLFPKILDTKHMASTSEFKGLKDTSLYSLVEYLEGLKVIPDVEICEDGAGYKMKDGKLHEAAYDAYVTGVCFLAMSKYLGNVNCNSNIFQNLPESPFLDSILNKLSVPKLCNISFMNIGGPDIEPDRLGVYHLKFPKEWTNDNIMDLFKNCGFIKISWINSTSAFVKVDKPYISEVEKNLMKKSENYKICSHSDFKSFNQCSMDVQSSPVKEKALPNKGKLNTENDISVFKSNKNESSNKRKMNEDIGEIIERPLKKQANE